MERLKLKLLGGFRLAADEEIPLPTRKAAALVAYLALASGRSHRREKLAGLLWGERGEQQARHSLRQTLSSIRKALGTGAADVLVAGTDAIALNPSALTVDVDRFESLAAEGTLEALTEAMALYGGDLLEGLNLREPAFEEWLFGERQRLRSRALNGFHTLLDLQIARSEHEAGIKTALRLLTIDPVQETVHRKLMQLYAERGSTDAALRQYKACADVLRRELGVQPEAETEQLYKRISQERVTAPMRRDQPMPTMGDQPAEPPRPTTTEAAPRAAPDAERKQVSILFAEIKGTAALDPAEDPEAALARIDPAVEAMREAVHRYEGTLRDARSDGVMAVFGAPVTLEDHAVRACYAALAMRDAVAALSGGTLAVRAGINSGEVVVRPGGDAAAPQYDAVGPAVSLASRLGQAMKPGMIGLSAETCRRSLGFINARPLGPTALDEMPEPVEIFQLAGSPPARSRWEARATRGLTAFVGRDEEVAKLARALERAGHSHGEVVAIVGEPGMGKSRLVHEFVQSPDTQGWTVFEAGASPHEREVRYAPVTRLLRRWLNVEDRDTQPEIADKLRSAIVNLDDLLSPCLPALQSLLGLPVTDPDWEALPPPQRRRRTLDAVKALFLRQSQDRPLILVFEDLHWIDGESQAVLDGLVDVIGRARLILLVTYRPEYRHDWAGRSYFRQIRADPLQSGTADRMLRTLLGTDPTLDDLCRALIARSEGVPLFLEEAVRSLIELGALDGEPGAYRLTEPVDRFEIPPTVQAVIAARIDRLPAAEKALLQVASVVGRDVPLALLEPLADLSAEALSETLAALQSAEFLYETRLFPDVEYAFKHALTHEVAYESVLKQRRRAIHRDVVDVIEHRFPDRIDEQLERLARHALSGQLWDKAADYLLRAAARAKAQYAYRNARALAQMVLDATAESNDLTVQRVAALVMLGDLASLLGDLDAANRNYDQALALEYDGVRRQRIDHRKHRSRHVVRNGVKIVYYEHGSGQQTLVFVHPFVYGLSVFQPIVERLCAEFRIITIDPRGTGASDPIPGRYSLDDHLADYCAVFDAAGLGQPITAVGISRGVQLLVKLAVARPAALDKIALVGGSFVQTVGIGVQPGTYTGLDSREMALFAKALERRKIRAAMRIFAPLIYSEPGTEELRQQFVEQCLRLPPDTVVNFFTIDPSTDISALVKRVTIPTLVMHGTEDQDTPFDAARELARAFPNAALYGFEGKGHLPTFTATDEFCDVLRQFARTGTAPKVGLLDEAG